MDKIFRYSPVLSIDRASFSKPAVAGAFAVDGRCPSKMIYDKSSKNCAFIAFDDWYVYVPEGDFNYEEAKAKCRSLGAKLVAKNAWNNGVIFCCPFGALTLPYVRFNL